MFSAASTLILPLPVYATIWIDRETFATIVRYCAAQSGFDEAGHDEMRVRLSEAVPPDIMFTPVFFTRPGSDPVALISVSFEGEAEACAELFLRGLTERQKTPTVRVGMAHEGEAVLANPDFLKREVAVHYSCTSIPVCCAPS